MLIVTAGKGWVQREDQARREIKPGDVLWIPAGIKHWHDATDTNGMSHIAVTYIRDGKNADWMELVTDREYGARSFGERAAAVFGLHGQRVGLK